ncbi:MAG: hypothetical protein HC910_07255 [Spirulinaceae cyanobacterium SM2_1_0]|nr:hypothetical protein [Spirulinaceae cyanobacterium SM2_1_0]
MQSQHAVAPSNAQAGAQSIFTTIETQLLHSDVYQQVLARVQSLSGEAAEAAQALLTAVGKEAARLAFQTLSQHYKVVPTGIQKAARQANRRPAPPPRRLQVVSEPAQSTATTTATPIHPATKTAPDCTGADQPTNPETQQSWRSPRMSKAERAQQFAREREAACGEIGATLRQAREAQGMSIGQLYSKTLVQVFYIKALEAGQVEQLPEDIYLRGFIRRLGNALGLDGAALAKSLPKQVNDSPIPSWYSPEMKYAHKSIGGVTPLHMYAGYTAAMATAIGGLGFVTSQQQPMYAQPDVDPDAAQTAPDFRQAEQAVDIDQQASAAIAPPEAL